jgi:hypothetical protein
MRGAQKILIGLSKPQDRLAILKQHHLLPIRRRRSPWFRCSRRHPLFDKHLDR